jgi:hypothetical protein
MISNFHVAHLLRAETFFRNSMPRFVRDSEYIGYGEQVKLTSIERRERRLTDAPCRLPRSVCAFLTLTESIHAQISPPVDALERFRQAVLGMCQIVCQTPDAR